MRTQVKRRKGTGKSEIIVTAPTGSTVYIQSQDGKRKDSVEKNGVWTFKGCDIGTWTVYASLDDQSTTATVEITEEGQLMRYYITIAMQLQPTDFEVYLTADMNTRAVLGRDYQVVYDDDTSIPQALWPTAKNWKYRNLVNLYVKALKYGYIDVFCVGGGAGAKDGYGGGAGGGYTETETVYVTSGTVYPIVIGAGGNNANGGNTSAFGVIASGGKTSSVIDNGGDGGSGGGAYGEGVNAGDGGSDGNDGLKASGKGIPGKGQRNKQGSNGEQGSTREFGDTDGKLYSGGGGAGSDANGNPGIGGEGGGGNGAEFNYNGEDGTKNTGGGGGGAADSASSGGKGGSGIVVFRNARS